MRLDYQDYSGIPPLTHVLFFSIVFSYISKQKKGAALGAAPEPPLGGWRSLFTVTCRAYVKVKIFQFLCLLRLAKNKLNAR